MKMQMVAGAGLKAGEGAEMEAGRDGGAKKPVKSVLKRKKAAPKKNAERMKWEAEQQAMIREQVSARLTRERRVLEACERLFATRDIEIEQLEEASLWISQDDYVGIVKERSLKNLCGYPLCANNAEGEGEVGESNRVRLLLYRHTEQKKGQQGKGRKFYCSNGCHRASTIFCSNLHQYRPLNDLVGVGMGVAERASAQASLSSPSLPVPSLPALPPSAARASAANAAAAAAVRGSVGGTDGAGTGTTAGLGGVGRAGGVANANLSAVLVDGIWRNAGRLDLCMVKRVI